MLHPAIESLLFLKIARNSVCESIKSSEVNEQTELLNYIQNEASDFEVMHLITLGEMPEMKFDDLAEQAVWSVFQEDMVKAYDLFTVEEGYDIEDVNKLIFEMGPVSELGLSSATPVMELHQHNGYLKSITEAAAPYEGSSDAEKLAFQKRMKKMKGAGMPSSHFGSDEWNQKRKSAKKALDSQTAKARRKVAGQETFQDKIADKTFKAKQKAKLIANRAKNKAKEGKAAAISKWGAMTPGQQATAKGVAGGAVIAGGAYLAYKLYKKLRDKFSKASGDEKAKIKKQMDKAKAKMKK